MKNVKILDLKIIKLHENKHVKGNLNQRAIDFCHNVLKHKIKGFEFSLGIFYYHKPV